ncbi:MAG: alpha/beta hydrolase [Anaerolineales bacterium]|nr:alpha/beta hydrolase [Anaerolineales bacterium]
MISLFPAMGMKEYKMECTIGDIKIHYEICGVGRPILMLHGWPVDHRLMIRAFEPIFNSLKGWKRIYLDLPGMGKTSSAEWIKTHEDMLKVVLDFIDQVIMDDHFLLIGWSYGAYLVRGVIPKKNGSIDGIMLYVPMIFANRAKRTLPEHRILFENPDLLEELKANNLEDLIVFITDQNDECLDNLRNVGIPSMAMADHEFLDAFEYEKGLSFERDDDNPSFSKPALIIVGRQDAVVGYQDAWRLIEDFPRATFAALDYAGHAVGVGERNIIFRALVEDWIDRVKRYTKD